MDVVLNHGEKVLWRGRPGRRLVTRMDLPQLRLAALLIVATAVLWTFLLLGGYSPGSLAFITGLTAVLLLQCVGPIFTRARRLRHTEYLVTDQRAVAVWGAPGQRQERSVAHSVAQPPTVVGARPDGVGSIVFGPQRSFLETVSTPYRQRTDLVLHEVEQADRVAALIRSQRMGQD